MFVINLRDLTLHVFPPNKRAVSKKSLNAGRDRVSKLGDASVTIGSISGGIASYSGCSPGAIGRFRYKQTVIGWGSDSALSHHVGLHHHLRSAGAPAVRRSGTLSRDGPRRYFAEDPLFDWIERGFLPTA
jgi:hypothetical protein